MSDTIKTKFDISKNAQQIGNDMAAKCPSSAGSGAKESSALLFFIITASLFDFWHLMNAKANRWTSQLGSYLVHRNEVPLITIAEP